MAVAERELNVRMRVYRELAGLSQAQLAAATGIHKNNLSGYERGDNVPGLAHFARIAHACGKSVSDLLGDNRRGFTLEAAGLSKEAGQ